MYYVCVCISCVCILIRAQMVPKILPSNFWNATWLRSAISTISLFNFFRIFLLVVGIHSINICFCVHICIDFYVIYIFDSRKKLKENQNSFFKSYIRIISLVWSRFRWKLLNAIKLAKIVFALSFYIFLCYFGNFLFAFFLLFVCCWCCCCSRKFGYEYRFKDCNNTAKNRLR